MKLPLLYVRRRRSDTWHYHPFCNWWAMLIEREGTIQQEEKPRGGELCNRCRAKDRADKKAVRK